MIKCYGCSTKPDHRFSDCLSVNCGCTCVREIYVLANQSTDDVSELAPKFLKIGNAEIKILPDLSERVTEFGKINKHEWLPVKKDRRFKRRKR